MPIVGPITKKNHIKCPSNSNQLSPGDYTFQLDAGDGVRMILGHDACPGKSCATRQTVGDT